MTDDRTETQVRVMRALERMARLMREIAFTVARDTVGTRATMSITRLLDQVGEAGVGDIAEALRVDTSVASRQISELVAAGLVERTVVNGDRRARHLRLTPAGRVHAEQIRTVMRDRADTVFEDWSADELGVAATVLERMVESTARAHRCQTSAASPPVAAAAAR